MAFGLSPTLLQLSVLLAFASISYSDDVVGLLPVFASESDLLDNMNSLQSQAVLVLSHGNGDEKCAKTVEQLAMVDVVKHITQYAEEEYGISGGVVGAQLKDKSYEKNHGFKGCPNLILYREKRPIVYDGENLHMRFNREEIGQWLTSNMKSNVNHLSDETFEHLTQASTGATTGDWLVWFHETSCSQLTAVVEALASRMKYSKVVGEVDTTLNPKLVKRFDLNECQSFILFRQGKYYKYTADVFDVRALANFAEISYQNFHSQVVRPPKSPFDEKVEQLTVWLKESDYGLYLLVGTTFFLFGGILYLVMQEGRQAVAAEKKAD